MNESAAGNASCASPPSRPLILHIDLDCFYCQVEQVRLGISGDQPLAVQQWQGLIAINYPARAAGIARHARVKDALEMCPDLRLVHVATYALGTAEPEYHEKPDQRTHKVSLDPYRRASAKIFAIFQRFAKHVQKASVDEAFIDVTEEVDRRLSEMTRLSSGREGESDLDDDDDDDDVRVNGLPAVDWTGLGVMAVAEDVKDDSASTNELSTAAVHWTHTRIDDVRLMLAARLAKEIRECVFRELGYTCSAGIAHNKTLAKLCSALNKPDKQTVLRAQDVPRFMRELPFQKIRFLGGKLGDEVEKRLNVERAGDVWPYSEKELSYMFGESGGWLYRVVRGVCHDPISDRNTNKSMLAAKSMRPPATSLAQIQAWLEVLSNEMFIRLREDSELNARWPKAIQVSFKSTSMPRARSRTTPMPPKPRGGLTSGQPIFEAALALIQRESQQSDVSMFPCEHVAVGFSGFVQDEHHQQQLSAQFFQGSNAKRPSEVVSSRTTVSTTAYAVPAKKSKSTAALSAAASFFKPRRPTIHSGYYESPHVPPSFHDAWSHDRPASVSRSMAHDQSPNLVVGVTPLVDRQAEPGARSPRRGFSDDAPDLSTLPIIDLAYERSSPPSNLPPVAHSVETATTRQPHPRPVIFPCPKCGETLYRDDVLALQEHEDWHFAQDLMREEQLARVHRPVASNETAMKPSGRLQPAANVSSSKNTNGAAPAGDKSKSKAGQSQSKSTSILNYFNRRV